MYRTWQHSSLIAHFVDCSQSEGYWPYFVHAMFLLVKKTTTGQYMHQVNIAIFFLLGAYSMVPNTCDHLHASYWTSPYLAAHTQPFLCGSLLHSNCEACYSHTPYSYSSLTGKLCHLLDTNMPFAVFKSAALHL